MEAGAWGSSLGWTHHTASSPVKLLCFPFPIKDSHLDIKFKYRLCHNHGTQELLLLVPGFYISCSPLNYLSRASVLHYLYVMSQQKWENDVPFLFPHWQWVCMQLPGVFPASLHSLIQSSPCQVGTHAFLLGGWVKPVSSQLRDDRQSQLHSKIRPIDLFQELHSSPECIRNLYCRLNIILQPPKYKCPLYIGCNSTAQAESELPRLFLDYYDYLVGILEPRNSGKQQQQQQLLIFSEPRNSKNNSTTASIFRYLIYTRN